MTLVLKDDLLDGQLLRLLGATPYGGADVGEAIACARTIDGTNLDSWFTAWVALGDRVHQLAVDAEAAGHCETARLGFWRASSYYRTAGGMLLGPPVDPRLIDAYGRQRDSFRRGAALLDRPPELLAIPYDDTTLPGYFFRCAAGADGEPRPLVIALGGYDSTGEEMYFANGAAALARGYNVLIFEGPGQGNVLLEQGLPMRADYEHVVGQVVNFAVARSDVDAERIALVGLSLGGYLAPRAASAEHRLAACIADCGSYDMYAGFLQRLPGPLRSGFEAGHHTAVATVGAMLSEMAKQPTGGWPLRRGMLVHGVDSPLDYVEAMKDFTLAGRAGHIECPTFVCNAADDPISASAPELVAALTCPHEFVTFTAAEGAGDHCEAAARTLFHARAFDWLDGVPVR